MNCQPNQPAMVVRNTANHPCMANMVGTPITTTESFESVVGTAWLYRGALLRCPSCGTPIFGFLDADLQPLRGQRKTSTTDRGVDVRRDEAVTA